MRARSARLFGYHNIPARGLKILVPLACRASPLRWSGANLWKTGPATATFGGV